MLVGVLRAVVVGVLPGLAGACWVFTAVFGEICRVVRVFEVAGSSVLDRFFVVTYFWVVAGVAIVWVGVDLAMWVGGCLCCCVAEPVTRQKDFH